MWFLFGLSETVDAYFIQVPSSKSGGLFSDSTESDDDGGLFSSKPITTSAPRTTVSHIVPDTVIYVYISHNDYVTHAIKRVLYHCTCQAGFFNNDPSYWAKKFNASSKHIKECSYI